ncbi:hypothetical protein [Haloferula sp.]|uniref:hypothetical protein n=1 Tax=Haloferula sp. TaxID=2497595 RepID=UPI003C76DE19
MVAKGALSQPIVIEISGDAIADVDDELFAGILAADDPNWSFTFDNFPPTPEHFHPIPGSDQAPLDSMFVIAFYDNPVLGSGNVDRLLRA